MRVFAAKSPGVWEEERTALLKRLFSSGHTAREVGAAVGTSRNAAIGKAKRLGLVPSATIDARIASRIVVESVPAITTGKARLGQAPFRESVLANYSSRCCVTGCDVGAVIEAAHIVPFALLEDHGVDNGLALRSDLHILFDRGLIAITWDRLQVQISPALASTEYAELHGRPTSCGKAHTPPSRNALRWHQRRVFVGHMPTKVAA